MLGPREMDTNTKNISVGELRGRPYTRRLERETEARREAGRGPDPHLKPMQDRAQAQRPPPQRLPPQPVFPSARLGRGLRRVSEAEGWARRGRACAEPGEGGRCVAAEGLSAGQKTEAVSLATVSTATGRDPRPVKSSGPCPCAPSLRDLCPHGPRPSAAPRAGPSPTPATGTPATYLVPKEG